MIVFRFGALLKNAFVILSWIHKDGRAGLCVRRGWASAQLCRSAALSLQAPTVHICRAMAIIGKGM